MSKGKKDVKQFVVGDLANGADFTPEEIETLIYQIALWFQQPECDRTYDDPVASARQKVRECLLAQTEAGDPWRQCPQEFNARVRAKCAYDMVQKVGIPSRRAKNPLAQRAVTKEAQEGAATLADMQPATVDFDQSAFREAFEKDTLEAFPELDNPAHKPTIRSLSGLYAEREKIDRQLALGVSDSKRELLLKSLKYIEDMADGTMRRMGIHPDQVRKKISDRMASSVADLVAMIEGDEEYRNRERIWSRQLALQLWWMSEHPNGRRDGPNLHDFEIWHMTRTRPFNFTCRCGREYKNLLDGFEPQELLEFLQREGVVVEEPVLPGVIRPEDLVGLATAFEKPPTEP